MNLYSALYTSPLSLKCSVGFSASVSSDFMALYKCCYYYYYYSVQGPAGCIGIEKATAAL